MQFLSLAVPLALASAALANPLIARGDACLAAITGKAALGDDSLRQQHCSSYLLTVVTPAAITSTVTVTGTPTGTFSVLKRDVTVCPNDVPNYASACNTDAYSSACSAFGIFGDKTTTIPATTNTKTVYVSYSATCSPSTATITGTVVSGSTCPPQATTTVTTGAASVSTVTVAVGGFGGNFTVTGGVSTVTQAVATTTVTVAVGGAGTNFTLTGGVSTVTEAATTVTVAVGGAGGNFTVTGGVSTVTLAATTVTVGGGNSTVTVTEAAATVTVGGSNSTVTVTSVDPTSTAAANSTVCLTKDKADSFVSGFKNLLEYTSYAGTQGPPGRGYNYAVSAATLAVDFVDYSDSINWMANFPLGSVTFGSKAAFDYGQGILQPELTVTTLGVEYGCTSVTWRWSALTPSGATVKGINVMQATADLSLIQTNYAEFDNAAWLYSFGLDCKVPASNSTTKRSTMF